MLFKDIKWSKLRFSLSSLFLLVFTFFIFGPLELYMTNSENLWFGLKEVLQVSLPLAFLCLTVCTLLIYLIPEKAHKFATAFLFGLGLAFYIQGNFMQIRYGVLDGKSVDWDSYVFWGIINTIIWILLIALPFLVLLKASEKFKKIVVWGTAFVVAIQIVTMATLFITNSSGDREKNLIVTTDNLTRLSKGKNIVFFILDSFDTRLMQNILNENPDYAESFEDFTFYENTTGKYPTTIAALPHILTSHTYKNDMLYRDYIDAAAQASQLYPILNEMNYDTGIYTDSRFIGKPMAEYLDNVEMGDLQINSYTAFSGLLYKFTATKYFPHIFKKYIWMYSGDFLSVREAAESKMPLYSTVNDVLFYNTVLDRGLDISDNSSGAFRLYHLYGGHPPYIYNENVEEGNGFTETQQLRGSLKIVEDYISMLKEQGIYENTMLFVISDHGHTPATLCACPLLMVKGWDEHKPFTVSSAPVSYDDLMPTVLNALTESKDYGTDLYDWKKNDKRKRLFYYYTWDDSWDIQYLPEIREYEIMGDSMDQSQYIHTGVSYSDAGTTSEDFAYQLGEGVFFGRKSQGDGEKYFLYGYNTPEDYLMWSAGSATEMIFDLPENPWSDLLLEINYEAMPGQSVNLYVNNQLLQQELTLNSGDTRSVFHIPAEVVRDNKRIMVKFEFPNAVSSFDLGINEDKRVLAVGFKSLKLSSADGLFSMDDGAASGDFTCQLGEEVFFGRKTQGEGEKHLLYGYHASEDYLTWSAGSAAGMMFDLSENPRSDLLLEINYEAMPGQSVNLYVNNQLLQQGLTLNSGDTRSVFHIPAEIVRDNKRIVVKFEFPNAVSSFDLGINEDKRVLAVGFKSLKLSSADDLFSMDDGAASGGFTCQLGEEVFFGRKTQGEGEKHLLYGYHASEDYLTWSAGNAAGMMFDLSENPRSDLLLEINYEAMPGQRINVYVNGHLLTQEFPLDAGASFCSIKIPLKMLQNNMQLFIQFEFPNAISSYKLGINEDTRVLAMGLKSLKMNSSGTP